MVPQSFAISGTATLVGFLVSRFGRYKWSLLAGPLIATVGVLLLSTIDRDTTAVGLAPYLVVLGFGLGLIFPNLTLAVQNAVDMADLGVATSTANFFRNMGSTFGAAVMGVVLSSRLDRRAGPVIVAADRLAEVGGAEGLVRSPKVIRELPTDLHEAVIGRSTLGDLRCCAGSSPDPARHLRSRPAGTGDAAAHHLGPRRGSPPARTRAAPAGGRRTPAISCGRARLIDATRRPFRR